MSTKCSVRPIFPNINTYAIFVSASKHMSGSQYLVKINLTWSFHHQFKLHVCTRVIPL